MKSQKRQSAALRAIRKVRNGETVVHGRRYLRAHNWATPRVAK